MSVYVDRFAPTTKFRVTFVCHMVADTHDELAAMAQAIGMKPAWIQKPGTHGEHFDLNESKRAHAVRLGAQEVTWREMAAIFERKRKQEAERSILPTHCPHGIDYENAYCHECALDCCAQEGEWDDR